jgi:hypothetical protein
MYVIVFNKLYVTDFFYICKNLKQIIMKKSNVLITLLTLFSVISFSQEVKFGLRGGLNIANQSNTSLSGLAQTNSSSIIGFNFGGYVEIELSNKISIQPELLFSLQGGKLSSVEYLRLDPMDPGEYVNVETVDKLSYINIPVMFKYNVTDKFTLELGPQLGILISSNRNTSFYGPTYSANSSRNSTDIYSTIDYGINLGAEYNISDNIAVGIRYNIGVNNIGKYSTEIKNNVFSISTNYKF